MIASAAIVAYGASKGGVDQLTRAMAEAWSGSGINVNALAPFMTETAERAANRMTNGTEHELVGEMLSATFDVICDVALSGRDHFDGPAAPLTGRDRSETVRPPC